MEPILQVQHLTHTYSVGTPFQRSAVEDMSFDVYDGEFLGIIGHTGSGKSTLIQHLNGLLRPTSGQILLHGKDIWAEPKKIRDVRFQVGLVFQYPEYQLFEETVYKDIAFGPINQGKTGEELDRCVREAARLVGIRDDQLDKSPFELSGGQKRRVALAGVMAMDPQVLVLDEPTAGLDPAGRENLMANIRDYHRNKKRTIILVSHSMDEIARNVDRILVLKSAHVLMSGTPAEVFARAEELLSAGLDVPQVTRIAMRLREQGLAILGRSIRIHGAGSTRTSRYADPCFAIYRGAERFGVFVILAAFRPQSIGRVVVEDDALQRPGIIRIVGIFRGNFKLQGAAGGNLHPLEAHHLKPIRIFCDLIAAEVALHHRRKQEFVLLVCGHHRSVLFVHSSFLLLIF